MKRLSGLLVVGTILLWPLLVASTSKTKTDPRPLARDLNEVEFDIHQRCRAEVPSFGIKALDNLNIRLMDSCISGHIAAYSALQAYADGHNLFIERCVKQMDPHDWKMVRICTDRNIEAVQGGAGTQYNLGLMYADDVGNAVEAAHWYRKAAEQGHIEAQYRLGAMYAEGDGVPEDYVEAIRWLRMAAEQGYAEAHYGLGVIYERSVGVPENNVRAYAWYIVAAAKGDAHARQDKERIAESMTPVEIAAAQKLAREYWEAYVLPFRD